MSALEGKPPTSRAEPDAAIQEAINTGVPLWNADDIAGCTAVYKSTAERYEAAEPVLATALRSCEGAPPDRSNRPTVREQGWILRRAMDTVLRKHTALRKAVRRGSVIFDRGDPAGCAALYTRVAQKFCAQDPRLMDALKEAQQVPDYAGEDGQAWVLRRGFDRILEGKAMAVVACDDQCAQTQFEKFYSNLGSQDGFVGLSAEPLVTLSEAVDHIWQHESDGAVWLMHNPEPTQEQLRAGVRSAYVKAGELLKHGADPHGLTREEIGAIHLYSQEMVGDGMMNVYGPLNASLRQRTKAAVMPYWPYLRLLQHALFKLPKAPRSDALFRGVRPWDSPPTEVDLLKLKDAGNMSPPSVDIWWGFSSTSSSITQAKTFTNVGEAEKTKRPVRVLYIIDGGSQGRDIMKYSEYPNEDELLIPCGAAFVVKDVTDLGPELGAGTVGSTLLVTLHQTDSFMIPMPEPEPELEA
jgi:hypothetical protein